MQNENTSMVPPAGQNPFEKGFQHLPKLLVIESVCYLDILFGYETFEIYKGYGHYHYGYPCQG